MPAASISPRLFSRLRNDLRPRSSGHTGPRSRGCAKRRESTDDAMVPSRSVFQTCLGRAWGGLIARDSRFEVAPPMFSGRLDSLPLRDPALSFSFFFLSLSFSFSFSLFPFTFSATPGCTRNRSNSRLYFSDYAICV